MAGGCTAGGVFGAAGVGGYGLGMAVWGFALIFVLPSISREELEGEA